MPQVVVKMRLPFRLQIAEGTPFQVQQPDGSVVYCTVTDYQVPKAEEDMHGTGVDDGLGTFLQSEVSIRFPDQSIAALSGERCQQYLGSAIAVVNQLIEAYRYVSRHASARVIERPLYWTLTVTDDAGNPIPNVLIATGSGFQGILGPAAVLNPKGILHVQEVLNGVLPTEYERLLLLDAQYFAMLADVRHAIFNADTALQVFIDRAVANTEYSQKGYYSRWDPGLDSVHGISPHKFQFPLQGQKINVMEIVELIHIVRDTIAHEGKPIFRVKHLGKAWEKKSHYVDNHKQREGIVVGADLARELVAMACGIVCELRKYLKAQPHA